jgi:site-specific DNA-methyltransferase (adenine-specific)
VVEMPTEAEPVTVVEGDCLDVLRILPDGCVDAVITDPPYNVGLTYTGDETEDKRPDYVEWCAEWFAALKRVCSGPILISCGVANLGRWHAIEQPTWLLCWHKPAAMGRCAVGFNNWEPVLVYGSQLKMGCDVFQASIRPDKSLRGHPCPKPLAWARKQLLAVDADIILDPFGGSGTTAVACIAEGRRCILVEKEPTYAAIARERVATAMGRGKGSLLAGLV